MCSANYDRQARANEEKMRLSHHTGIAKNPALSLLAGKIRLWKMPVEYKNEFC
jgi:hypothetical protein